MQAGAQIARDITPTILARTVKLCNFLDYQDYKASCRASPAGGACAPVHLAHPARAQVVYKRYASLYFVMGIDASDNELITLEVIHHYVEVLDKYFGNVCELDLIFNFHKVGDGDPAAGRRPCRHGRVLDAQRCA